MDEQKEKKSGTSMRKRAYRTHLQLKRLIFFTVFFFFALLGLLLPARPSESAIENRTLTDFPAFTISSFLSGDWFSDISTWYADTFPLREKLLAANASFESLYGMQQEQIVQNTSATADEVPDEGTMVSADATEEEPYVDGAIEDAPEQAGNVYVTGDTAFEIYYFSLSSANSYIEMIDRAQECLGDDVQIYDILVPTSSGVSLSDAVQEEIGASSQSDAIDYVTSNLNESVKTVSIFNALRQHNTEYIYFRTDHHWTALGAYYAYVEFCEAKGIEANDLEDYETMEFTDFVGSFYASSNQAASLLQNPDTVTAYIPLSTNDMFYIEEDGDRIEWDIIHDVTDYPTDEKYAAFAAGDQCYAQIDNPLLDDGSACVVIKESFGNAFIPFLVDHYQTVYIVDYRYFANYSVYGNSVYLLVTQNDVSDVIFLNNVNAMTTQSRIDQMASLFYYTGESDEADESGDASGDTD